MLLAMMLLAFQPADSAPRSVTEVIVVRQSAARPAIERILRADNIDVEELPPQEVAARMEEIVRGAAPAAFWAAYQAHVGAWRAYADATSRSRNRDPRDDDRSVDGAAIASARARINVTFDRVQAIAAGYGVRVPPSLRRR